MFEKLLYTVLVLHTVLYSAAKVMKDTVNNSYYSTRGIKV